LGSQCAGSLLIAFTSLLILTQAEDQKEFGAQGYDQETENLLDEYAQMQRPAQFYDDLSHLAEKRGDMDGSMPGVLRFGKRAQSFIRFGRSDGDMQKKEMPGVLRFGKRSPQEKKSMPGVLRFGKRSDMPGMLRFGKRDEIPGVLRFGKKSVPGVLRFGRK